jgi:hypothetical protein
MDAHVISAIADDREIVARCERQLAESPWSDRRALIEPVANGATSDVIDVEEAVLCALRRRQEPVARAAAGPEMGAARHFGCSSHVASPPFETGDPLDEVYGVDPTIVHDPVFVPASVRGTVGGLAEPGARKTFSRLAVPAEGAVSLAVGLGKLPSEPQGFALYPPQAEYPQGFPGPVAAWRSQRPRGASATSAR